MNSIKRIVTIAVLTLTSISAGANDELDNSVEQLWLDYQKTQQLYLMELAESEEQMLPGEEQSTSRYEEIKCTPYPQCKG